MADKKRNANEIKRAAEEKNRQLEIELNLLEQQLNTFNNIYSKKQKLEILERKIAVQSLKIKNYEEEISAELAKGLGLHHKTQKSVDEQITQQKKKLAELSKEYNNQKNLIKGDEKRLKSHKNYYRIKTKLVELSLNYWKYMMEVDDTIRSMNRELGLSGFNSDRLRENFTTTLQETSILGATIKDIAESQAGFVEQTGRANEMTSSMLKDITTFGLAVGLSSREAGILVGQFRDMGVAVSASKDMLETAMETTELMGVSATKVFKNISNNFRRLQTLTFKGGVNDMIDMATYAEKFRVDMSQILDSAEKARTLEGAVELAAQLQVMGGEFAKTDPFEILFLSRNDPAEFTKKINEMTKGIVTWRKNSEGVMEKFISPADRDRLFAVAKALGMQGEQLMEQSLRMADINRIRQQARGLGLDDEQMKALEGMASISKNGIVQIQTDSGIKDIVSLTKEERDLLVQQGKTLEQRAQAALTFDKQFQATIQMLKASLLPILDTVNAALAIVQPMLVGFSEWISKLDSSTKAWIGAGFVMVGLLGKATTTLIGALIRATATKAVMGGGAGNVAAAGAARKGAGMGMLRGGVGIGAAGLGVGAGIGAAAVGISEMAKAIKDVDVDKLEKMNWTLGILGATTLGALAIGLFVVGKATEANIIGLGVLGGVALAIGASIGIAATGIGKMAEGLSTLENIDLLNIGLGMGAIAASSYAFISPLAIAGFAAMTLGVKAMAANASGIEKVGDAFRNIGVVMSGNVNQLREVKELIDSISNSSVTSNNPIAQLASVLDKPLKVQFDDKEVALNVSLEMDGDIIYKKVVKPHLATMQNDIFSLKQGK